MKNLPRYTVRKNLVLNGNGELRGSAMNAAEKMVYVQDFMEHNEVEPWLTPVSILKSDHLQSLLDELLMYKIMYGEIPQETKEAFYAKLPK